MRTLPLLAALFLPLAMTTSPGGVGPVPKKLRKELRLDPFYSQHLDVDGLPVLGSERVSAEAFDAARALIERMLAKDSRLVKRLVKNDVRVVIMAANEVTTDVPEHADLNDEYERTGEGTDWNQRARGLGATRARPVCSVGEENLLGAAGDRYRGESILIHEFAHTLHRLAIESLDRRFEDRLEKAYEAALAAGLWKRTYAATNPAEYFAEGVQSWFDANLSANPADGVHNEIDTRAELQAYDPSLAKLVAAWFEDDEWRYEYPREQATDH